MASGILVSSRHKGTLPVEGIVEAVEGGVVRVSVALAYTVVATLRPDALLTLAYQTGGTEAARDAGAILRA